MTARSHLLEQLTEQAAGTQPLDRAAAFALDVILKRTNQVRWFEGYPAVPIDAGVVPFRSYSSILEVGLAATKQTTPDLSIRDKSFVFTLIGRLRDLTPLF
jgi:hypothetical protein